MPDQPFTPRVGDKILVVSDLSPAVTQVILNLKMDCAWVTLADPGTVTDSLWQAIHENLGLGTPPPETSVDDAQLVHPFDGSGLTKTRFDGLQPR